MKKTLLSIFAGLMLISQASFAQVPNGDFESTNYDGTIQGWGNVYLMSVVIDTGGVVYQDSIVFDGPFYAKTTDAHSGSYAMEMRNAMNYTSGMGMAGSVSADTDSVYSAWGSLELIELTQQPTSLDFFYKYTSVNGDSGLAQLHLYNLMGDEIGNAISVILPSANYAYMSVPVTMLTADPVAYYSLNFSTKVSYADYPTLPALGSSLIIDDVTLGGINGIKSPAFENQISLFPNPAHDQISIHTDVNQEMQYRIFNQLNLVYTYGVILGGVGTVSIGDLPSGVYTMELSGAGKKGYKKFVVVR